MNNEGNEGTRWRSPGPNLRSPGGYSPQGRGHWQNSPNRGWGRSPGPGGCQQSPRFRGNKSFSPRQPQWSPYPPFATSTPINRHYQPRFQHRFPRGQNASPHHRSQEGGIENWVSPSMWDDPWKEFASFQTPEGDKPIQDFSDLTDSASLSKTKFMAMDSSYNSASADAIEMDLDIQPITSLNVDSNPEQAVQNEPKKEIKVSPPSPPQPALSSETELLASEDVPTTKKSKTTANLNSSDDLMKLISS